MPTEEQWPGFSSLPNVSKITWKAPTRGKLREMFPSTSFSGGVFLNDTGFDLLSKMLHMDPKQVRHTASAEYMNSYSPGTVALITNNIILSKRSSCDIDMFV